MILTCPDCATRYFVPDDKVGPTGRTVKCSACGTRWSAQPEADLELFVDPNGAQAREPSEAKPDEAPVSALPGEELPKVFRQKATNERRVREAATAGVVWAGMGVALVAIVAAAVVFRGKVVDIWPTSAAAYAGVGLPVNRVGLTLEEVRAEAALQDGHAALVVSGIMRNVEDRPVKAPPLRIELLNREAKVVRAQLSTPADPIIPPGETRHFAVSLLDPPTSAVGLDIGFELAKGAKGEPAHAPQVEAKKTKVALRGAVQPSPVPPAATTDAQPLPADSPYALPAESH
ncbi:DUF3426 domain-containing protein [Caulobacter mirabilis]|nr:DUF3426 domain-containing protein [Caulobacter mirabilis]